MSDTKPTNKPVSEMTAEELDNKIDEVIERCAEEVEQSRIYGQFSDIPAEMRRLKKAATEVNE